MSSNPSWKDIMRTQEEDLQRLALMDAELNENQEHLDVDINHILKKSSKIRNYNVKVSESVDKPSSRNRYSYDDDEFEGRNDRYRNQEDNKDNAYAQHPPIYPDERPDSANDDLPLEPLPSSRRGQRVIDDNDKDFVDRQKDEVIPKTPEAASRCLPNFSNN